MGNLYPIYFFIVGFGILISGLNLLLVEKFVPQSLPGGKQWAFGGFFVFSGFLLIGAEGWLPEFISTSIANSFFVVAMITGEDLSFMILLSLGVLSLLSSIILIGCLLGFLRREFKRGLSFIMVLTPNNIASTWLRSLWTNLLDDLFVIHFEWPKKALNSWIEADRGVN